MYLYGFIGILIIFSTSCQSQPKVSSQNIESIGNIVSKMPQDKADSDKLIESFSDDSNIGQPRKNKVELDSDGDFVVIKFYSLESDKSWKLKQTFEFEKKTFISCDPQLKDYNGDGLKDFTYQSYQAARGANELRKLFLYDGKKDELIYIKNSDEHPNLKYSKTLNCLTDWHVYGGNSTEFMKIDGDVLKEFANVQNSQNDNGDFERKVYLIDKNGNRKLVRKDKISYEDDFFTQYENYNPPTPYESDDFEN